LCENYATTGRPSSPDFWLARCKEKGYALSRSFAPAALLLEINREADIRALGDVRADLHCGVPDEVLPPL